MKTMIGAYSDMSWDCLDKNGTRGDAYDPSTNYF